MFIFPEDREIKEEPKLILKGGICYRDAKTIPDQSYNPVNPKGKQMPLQPDGCYKVTGGGAM